MAPELRYPIGTQSFKVLREDNCVYVDKTGFVYRMANGGPRYYFLSRPRRFGKSLLLSTFEAYFRGEKELFHGLEIEGLEHDWTEYPVLHFDLSGAEATEPQKLEAYISNILSRYEDEYQIERRDRTHALGERFGLLIEDVCKLRGRRVVVLIDEYDKGLIEVLKNTRKLEANQNLLRPFFAQLKAKDAYIRFCLITGVARFRHFTIFSGLNNLRDISLLPEYATICGITDDELNSQFTQGISELAATLGVSTAAVLQRLKQKYDNYRFSESEATVYNPFCLLSCLMDRRLANYWVMSGSSKVFEQFLFNTHLSLTDMENLWATEMELAGEYSTENPIPLLYQTGYLTIGDYKNGLYRLVIPNGEVRSTLVYELIPRYFQGQPYKLHTTLDGLRAALDAGDADKVLHLLQSFISCIPYQLLDWPQLEKTYHLVIYQAFLMLGIDAKSEISISGGRIDMVAQIDKFVYVFEFKLNASAQSALEQINSKGYALPWQANGRKVFKIGVSFSKITHTIDSWLIEE